MITNYSAEVDMWIECGEQAAPTFVITATPAAVPACTATLVLMIDGKRLERRIRLVEGLSPESRRAMICAHVDVVPF